MQKAFFDSLKTPSSEKMLQTGPNATCDPFEAAFKMDVKNLNKPWSSSDLKPGKVIWKENFTLNCKPEITSKMELCGVSIAGSPNLEEKSAHWGKRVRLR